MDKGLKTAIKNYLAAIDYVFPIHKAGQKYDGTVKINFKVDISSHYDYNQIHMEEMYADAEDFKAHWKQYARTKIKQVAAIAFDEQF